MYNEQEKNCSYCYTPADMVMLHDSEYPYICSTCFYECMKKCEDCGEYKHEDDQREVKVKGEYHVVCNSCIEEGPYQLCDMCEDELQFEDDLYLVQLPLTDDMRVCDDCYCDIAESQRAQ